eukprot:CAMPEP_0174911132 /NCGR_PEP_ID=MMETSP0167-20121228/75537_1 /TAXON_ID=38298 /ORGANISM="Rhodella maculata, Strain CCMP736" /LENGTH=71 /DNA_ID=CAMNT_0016155571 /DNA_START=45 /DNA_END=256 /DNA_ORIENTATION=+
MTRVDTNTTHSSPSRIISFHNQENSKAAERRSTTPQSSSSVPVHCAHRGHSPEQRCLLGFLEAEAKFPGDG